MLKYRCLKTNFYERGEYKIVPFQKQNIQTIRVWRNEQIYVLRQNKLLTKDDQEIYYEKFIRSTYNDKNPKQLLFSLYFKKLFIAYGGLVNISWENKRAELSFLLKTDIAKCNNYKNEFMYFLDVLNNIAFKDLELNKIFSETYDIRDYHLSILEESGYNLEGVMNQHIIIKNSTVNSLVHAILKKDWLVSE
tara:strand:- start:259 stop:834 length:576 start_codon:yes stop_codon:yes gene_type:complete